MILFLSEANFHIIDKQLLINYQIVTSGLGIAHSYYVATVGVNNKPVQNTQCYQLIQPRSISTHSDRYYILHRCMSPLKD